MIVNEAERDHYGVMMKRKEKKARKDNKIIFFKGR